jgi:putative ABC transport system permease protein
VKKEVSMMETILRQIRLAMRLLMSRPSFSIIAITTLALGIGASTAVFTAVNAILLRPLPFGNPDGIVSVSSTNQDATGKVDNYGVSITDYLDWTERNQVFRSLAAMEQAQISLTGLGQPQQVDIGRITANFFPTLEVQPLLGRFFLPKEQTNSSNIVILSYGLWQQLFAGEADILGKTIQLDGIATTIVGVTPSSFYYAAPCQLWLPMNLNVDRTVRTTAANLAIVGRLKPDISVERAADAMASIANQLTKEYPASNTGWGTRVKTIREQITGETRSALLILMTAVSFLVLIASANVATLILARSVEREPEFALRVALGAERRSLFLQLLIENLVLTICGGVIGLLLSMWFLKPILMLSPIATSAFTTVAALEKVTIDFRVVLFTLAISFLTGIFFGTLPILRQWTKDPGVILKENGHRASAGVSHRRMLNFLVVSEISLALVLLFGATLTITNFLKLEKVQPGFHTENVLISKIAFPSKRYDHAARAAFADRLRENISNLPGVVSVAITNRLPLNEFSITTLFEVEGKPLPSPGQGLIANFRRISPDYFRTIGTPLLEGRDFEGLDKDGSPIAIVSSEMARRYWPGQSALGKRIKRFSRSDQVWRTIVGIVGDVKDTSLTDNPGATLYVPFSQGSFPTVYVVVRSSIEQGILAEGIRRSVWTLDKDIPVYDISSMEALFSKSLSKPRFISFLLTAFAVLGFLVATLGVYGVISYSMTQRVQEIGIRMALGAPRTSVMWLAFREGSIPVITGIAVGLLLSIAINRLGLQWLPEISSVDYQIASIVPAGLILASLLAILIPASRATRLDPVIALRCE